VHKYASAQALLESDLPNEPVCLVIEAIYKSICGLELQSRLLSRGRFPHIVFVTRCAEVAMAVAAMQAGAVNYLTKPASGHRLNRAVDSALELDEKRRRSDQSIATVVDLVRTLTRREREVMTLVAAGRLNKQIAADLGITEVTVKMHRAQVMRKLSVRNGAELVSLLDRAQAGWRESGHRPEYARYQSVTTQGRSANVSTVQTFGSGC
jgi:FixJ family two-component response regulator